MCSVWASLKKQWEEVYAQADWQVKRASRSHDSASRIEECQTPCRAHVSLREYAHEKARRQWVWSRCIYGQLGCTPRCRCALTEAPTTSYPLALQSSSRRAPMAQAATHPPLTGLALAQCNTRPKNNQAMQEWKPDCTEKRSVSIRSAENGQDESGRFSCATERRSTRTHTRTRPDFSCF